MQTAYEQTWPGRGLGNKPFNRTCMKQKTWTRVAAVVLAALLLWWLFWAILADEDAQQIEMQDTEIVE